ncbi:DUF6980 family protein [Streptomyces goshikiensis]|uniref:DUF6980 family protein n=1 Tax=Streptomyces goshikiensis TaxID=1942 RepID=UPI00381B01A9
MMSLIGNATDQAPANPAATDETLATQPVGYWSGLAHATVTRHLCDAMAKIDVTQPQYWVLNRVNGGPAAPNREEVVASLTHLADAPHEISRVVDQLLHREWLSIDDGQGLHLTDAGEAARARLRELTTEVASQRDRWFDELERRGIDPSEDEVPAEFQDDRWLVTPQE